MFAGRALSRRSRGLRQALSTATVPIQSTPLSAVNAHHVPDDSAPPTFSPQPNQFDAAAVSAEHWSDEPWSAEAIRAAQSKHVVATWGATRAAATLPIIRRGEGVYLYDADGKQYLDWTSQAVCTNLGHSMLPAVSRAINQQMSEVPMVYGGLGIAEVRCRMAQLMSEILPGDLCGALFPCGGAEANEAAIRIARRYTGRKKIMTQYRSYHGGSTNTLAATGDFRRWFAEDGATGMVRMLSPNPTTFSWGGTPEEATAMALSALEEQVLHEGPQTIAAVLIESVIGSGGVLPHPPGYIQGVRALCDKYGILYIADEVMVGFGRTGKWWGFQQYDGVVPDMVTCAKGLSAAWLPLAAVAMRQPIKDFFEDAPLGWGATYQGHPTALACAYEVVKHMLRHDVVGHAASLEPIMLERIGGLVDDHPSVRQGRALGAFGCLDLVDADGRYVQPVSGPPAPAALRLKQALADNGIYGLFRPPFLHCAPPLNISEAELHDGFDRVDRALTVFDEAIGV